MMRRLLVSAVLLGFAGLGGAHEIDLSFNGDALRFVYAAQPRAELRLDAGWLHDNDYGEFIHGGLQVIGNASVGPSPVRAGIGGRLAYFDSTGPGRNGYGLAVGGSFRWAFPRYDRFNVSGELFYAPDVLSGGDSDEFIDLTGRLGWAVTRAADVYVGARYVRAGFKQRPDNHFDTGMNLGFNIRF